MDVRSVHVHGTAGTPGAEPVELVIAEAGVGGRPLLLVHGFTGAKEDFTDWLDELAALGWHAVAVDQRGHGASHKPDDPEAYSFEIFAGDLLALLDGLGWASAVVLGHSMGGMVVQTAALQAPERFEALVLMGTSHRALKADPDLIEAACTIVATEGMAVLRDVLDAVGGESPVDSDIDRKLKSQRPEYKAFGDRKLLDSSPAMYAQMVRSLTGITPGPDRLDDLRGLALPVLVLVGEHDKTMLAPSKRMADAIPGAELAVIPGGAHSPQFEAPEPCWAAMRSFLSRLEPAGSAS
jgi:pimeloyl-ACP methyl ester carboxylesterase